MIETRSGTATRERTQRWRSAIAGETKEMQARTASAEEKTAMWPDIVTTYKGYAGYQKRTNRDIPVVICEQRGA
jgi:F420H(2)-dependent quinone reductase